MPGSSRRNARTASVTEQFVTVGAGALAAIVFVALFAPLFHYAFRLSGWPITDSMLLGFAALCGGVANLVTRR